VNEPVVSLSIGDTCRFRFGNADNRGKPYTDTARRWRTRQPDLVLPTR
jgi:alkylated DNA repair dioxygenase AlkB